MHPLPFYMGLLVEVLNPRVIILTPSGGSAVSRIDTNVRRNGSSRFVSTIGLVRVPNVCLVHKLKSALMCTS